MRLNRRKRREIVKHKSKQYYLLFFFVLPIAALVIGYSIAKFIIIPIFFQ